MGCWAVARLSVVVGRASGRCRSISVVSGPRLDSGRGMGYKRSPAGGPPRRVTRSAYRASQTPLQRGVSTHRVTAREPSPFLEGPPSLEMSPDRVVDYPLGLRSQGPEFKSPSGRFCDATRRATARRLRRRNSERRFEHDSRSATGGSDRLSPVQISVRTFTAFTTGRAPRSRYSRGTPSGRHSPEANRRATGLRLPRVPVWFSGVEPNCPYAGPPPCGYRSVQ